MFSTEENFDVRWPALSVSLLSRPKTFPVQSRREGCDSRERPEFHVSLLLQENEEKEKVQRGIAALSEKLQKLISKTKETHLGVNEEGHRATSVSLPMRTV